MSFEECRKNAIHLSELLRIALNKAEYGFSPSEKAAGAALAGFIRLLKIMKVPNPQVLNSVMALLGKENFFMDINHEIKGVIPLARKLAHPTCFDKIMFQCQLAALKAELNRRMQEKIGVHLKIFMKHKVKIEALFKTASAAGETMAAVGKLGGMAKGFF